MAYLGFRTVNQRSIHLVGGLLGGLLIGVFVGFRMLPSMFSEPPDGGQRLVLQERARSLDPLATLITTRFIIQAVGRGVMSKKC